MVTGVGLTHFACILAAPKTLYLARKSLWCLIYKLS